MFARTQNSYFVAFVLVKDVFRTMTELVEFLVYLVVPCSLGRLERGWRRFVWKLKRWFPGFFLDTFVILLGVAIITGLWYMCFCLWPSLSH